MDETISLRICQEGHANALALNRDCNQIAVAGRSCKWRQTFKLQYFGELICLSCEEPKVLPISRCWPYKYAFTPFHNFWTDKQGRSFL